MTKGTRIASLLSGAVMAFGLLVSAAPGAHADGDHRDGSRHRAGVDTSDWPQGKSTSDPDGDSNGGWDKPGFAGGFDDDRDGNNGCGNDSDREDDNNGWCGRHQDGDGDDTAVAGAAEDKDDDGCSTCANIDATVSAAGTVTPLTTVAAQVMNTAIPDSWVAAVAAPATSVLGAAEVAPIATSVLGATEIVPIDTTAGPTAAPGTTGPSALARTGAIVAGVALLGWLCLGGGRLTALTRRLLGS
ncbi:MAG: hypothetical protein ACRD0C_17265 [Acidimicrobiia bacterium]